MTWALSTGVVYLVNAGLALIVILLRIKNEIFFTKIT